MDNERVKAIYLAASILDLLDMRPLFAKYEADARLLIDRSVSNPFEPIQLLQCSL